MNSIKKFKLKHLLMCFGAVFALLAVFGMFFANPTAHIAPGGMLAASAGGLVLEKEAGDKVVEGVKFLTAENAKLKSDYQKVLDDYSRTDKEVKKAAEDIQKLMTTCNDQAQLIASLKKLEATVLRNAKSSFGDPIQRALGNEETRAYFHAIGKSVAAKMTNSRLDPAFEKIIGDGNAAFKSLTGVDAGLGQATVPQATFNEIYDTLLNYGQWNTLGVMRVGMRTTVIPVASARPIFYWIGSGTGGTGEGSAITAGAFTGSSVTLVIQTLAAYITISRELLADSTVDLAPYVIREMTQACYQGLDTAAFIANGAADQTNAGYIGIFNAASANVNMAATTAQGNTTVAGTQLDDWENVLNTVNPEVLNRGPKWWMHPQMLAKAILVRDKNGRPIFQTWLERPDTRALGNILGYPVIPTNIAPSTDGPGNVIAAFGDPQGQAIGIREDLEMATSDDINFAQNMRAFRTLLRAGVKMKTTAGSTSLVPFAAMTLSPN